jgi:hypothetical protein
VGSFIFLRRYGGFTLFNAICDHLYQCDEVHELCQPLQHHWSRRHKYIIADPCFGSGSVVIWRRFATLGFSQTQLFFFFYSFRLLYWRIANVDPHAFNSVACLHKILISKRYRVQCFTALYRLNRLFTACHYFFVFSECHNKCRTTYFVPVKTTPR